MVYIQKHVGGGGGGGEDWNWEPLVYMKNHKHDTYQLNNFIYIDLFINV